ncbi:hypothetical protein GQ43DRAFT_473919 [Delitschia confertaspora ATCC 74209]|uniref:DUF7702 domain-containing protein n=1 Tax=Delitschia confertaspora ATCC 74209 TaxID=1513339 RepID=A0A9P4JL32_9PLEO|nr:hypothetical protein GQ43DRAFT_473919 [Delitschia confertaspora ATCC 74209]
MVFTENPPGAGMANKGPPYVPSTWAIGGIPKIGIDIPITAAFLFLYICGAATHMTIFQRNKRRGHKFLISVFTFGFCMARIATCTLRIASISLPKNIRLSIAASIFVSAGVLILFLVNLVFAQRIIRAMHPRLGWHPVFSISFKIAYVLIVLTLAIVITAAVQTFYSIRPRTRQIDRDLQLYGATFLAIVSFLPIPMVTLSFLLPRKSVPERFGTGSLPSQAFIVVTGSFFLTLGAWFRCGTAWKRPVPRSQPLPEYYARACFYVFIFVVEVIVVYFYAAMRVDKRFWVPNGAKGPGSYEAGAWAERLEKEEVDGGMTDYGERV